MSEMPFKEPLISSEFKSTQPEKLRMLKSNPEKIIRVQKLRSREESSGGEKLTDSDAFEKAETAKRLFDELREHYGIVAPVDFIVAKNEHDEDSVYIITDRVHGKKLNMIKNPEMIDDLYTKLTQYYHDKFRTGDYYLTDIFRLDQYVYGTTATNNQEQLYLVDTDTDSNNNIWGRCWILAEFIKVMKTVEKKQGKIFSNTRAAMKDLLEDSSIVDLYAPDIQTAVKGTFKQLAQLLQN